MIIAKVTGTVVCTQKIKDLAGKKLLVVRPMSPDGKTLGKPMVAVDTVQAGPGDKVLVIDEGGSAGVMLNMSSQAIRTVIAGIIDRIDPADPAVS